MTTSAVSVDRVRASAFSWEDDSGSAGAIRSVLDEAAAEDGRTALNEAALLSLRHNGLASSALWQATADGFPVGFALVSGVPDNGSDRDTPLELDLVVTPASRQRGVASALVRAVVEAFGPTPLVAWSHGNHPAAAALAEAHGFRRARDLWVMRRPLDTDLPAADTPASVVVRPFRPGQDEDAFLAINAEAFADHPEQGGLTRADLERRMAESWFDPAGFFLAERSDAPEPEFASVDSPSLLGFHWTKVHADEGGTPYGEVYVVGVAPAAQGMGLGKALTLTGLRHLRSRGLDEVILYVEADNAPAIAVYSGLGFTHDEADTDVQYRRG